MKLSDDARIAALSTSGFHRGKPRTILVSALFWDESFVHGDSRTEVDGLRAYHIGIAFGIAKAIDMSIEPAKALEIVYAMLDILPCETI